MMYSKLMKYFLQLIMIKVFIHIKNVYIDAKILNLCVFINLV